MSYAPRIGPRVCSKFRKLVYNLSGFNRYGLHRDDCLDPTNSVVAEALTRLPKDIIEERNYRLLRAMQLSLTHSYLPKKEWTQFEKDTKYLEPYIIEVCKEFYERQLPELN